MAASSRQRAGGRYRGSRRPSGGVIACALVLLVLLLAWGVIRLFSFLTAPRAAAAPTPAPAAPSVSVPPTPSPTPAPEFAVPPDGVHGIYISGPVAGDPYLDTLLTLIDETELNTVVIDVKNDEGNLTYRLAEGTPAELGACVSYIRDLPGLVSSLKERGIYTIARISAFKDPLLAQARPDLALRRADGTPLSEGGDLAWVNPYEQEVWDYLTEIALGAADAGFDEVQFDYVRFPTGKDVQEADYGPAAQNMSREDAIVAFLEHVRTALHERGVWLSADVFGAVIGSKVDAGLIGQDYARMAQAADFLCPMVYPSHYAAGAFGLAVPDQKPYETVLAALKKSQSALALLPEENRAQIRPWLQDFTATWVSGHIPYGEEELRAQIQAVYDAGYTGWLLWNARNSYTAGGLLPAQP
ncbi:sugar fermentation stimulation protein [Pseudoflavonifractor sp. 524-17]|uniref:putative glycoside hydrolase n=1 Tax=Pseudoflavonifractor sp. 524-17 TaxID=2304577 RepID=UPI00137A8DFE|nr:putative glycoside hydrolase [Pseudoflavonifractor sp. 524-17]NCE66210.1 sugar fermentation stimulation protein [Pseudoflavonifractor sp. 524-17]